MATVGLVHDSRPVQEVPGRLSPETLLWAAPGAAGFPVSWCEPTQSSALIKWLQLCKPITLSSLRGCPAW